YPLHDCLGSQPAPLHTRLSVSRTQLGGSMLCGPNHKTLAVSLEQIGVELDGNTDLQSMINDTALQPSQEVFMRVACEIFSDGTFNWGRVVFTNEGIRSYFGTPTWQTVGVFLAGVLTTVLVIRKM
uniref:Bcl-2 Bcl-2 homology region 1-3 domain-containing protein n=1 Tax=Hucho hucho TaxID=62062 RepID=A0A4W5JZJ8_9TELE